MKKLFYVIIAIVLISCGGSELETKKKKLEEVKTKISDLEKEMKELEKYISENDTSIKNEKKQKKVKLAEVKIQPYSHFFEVQGIVDSEENAFVSPAMPGLITAINVKEGDLVGRGTVLASTEAGALQNSLLQLKTNLDLAVIAYDKQKRLWDQNIGSEIQYLQAKTQKESLEAQKKALESQLAMTRVIAPFNGTVDEVKVKLGEMASPGFTGIRVVNLDKIKVVAKVSDTYINKVKQGAPVQVIIPDVNQIIDTKISFVSKAVNMATRSFTIEVKLNNKEKLLRPNLIAKVNINDEFIDKAIIVPSNTLQKNLDGSTYLLVAEKQSDGKYFSKKANVEIGSNYNGFTVIKSGLTEGQQIIVEGFDDLVEGQELDIK